MSDDMRLMEPQPKCGAPFRIHFTNRGPEYWYNERRAYRDRRRGDMLFEWKCPFGSAGRPQYLDGVWYWVRDAAVQAGLGVRDE